MEERTTVHDDRPVIHREYVEHDVTHPMWSPAQLIALALGIGFLVFGILALVRAGLGELDTHVSVGGLHHTQLLGIIHLGAGAFFLAAGAIPGGGRSLMALLGAAALVFGIVVVIDPQAFHDWVGTHGVHGVIYIAVGAVSLIAAIASPIWTGGRRWSHMG